MKQLFLSFVLISCLVSCEKEDQPVSYEYTNLHDTTVVYNHGVELDLDKDGEKDFTAATLLIGTATTDRIQFRISSKLRNRILLQEEELPAVMESNTIITKNDQLPYLWSAIGSAIIIERIIPLNLQDSYWEGAWKNKQSKFLPVQLVKQAGKVYNGWIRISFSNDAQPKIILHDAAVSKTANVHIIAGQQRPYLNLDL